MLLLWPYNHIVIVHLVAS